MAETDTSKDLQQFRRDTFGTNTNGETMPPAFLTVLRHLVTGADAVLGTKTSVDERQGFWLRGRSLGVLSCRGMSDEDAQIDGRVIRLDALRDVHLEVPMEYNRWENSSTYGRVLTIDGDIKFSSAPGAASADLLSRIEDFIDRVLILIAGGST
ncbi:hypothetical protein [Mycobacterium sp. URHB0021]|jgi:hypothetical protein